MGFAKARKAAGYSQVDAAKLMGVSPAAVCQWETGVKNPTVENLMKMSNLYRCTLDDLLRAEDEKGDQA